MLGAAALRAEPQPLGWARTRLAVGCRPLVGGVLEDQPDRRAIPGRFAGSGGDSLAFQAAADFADGAPFLADPAEDLPHDTSLFGHDLITRRAVALVLADVAVAVGRAAEY